MPDTTRREDKPMNPDDEKDYKEALQAADEEFEKLLEQHMPGGSEANRGELMELPVVALRDDNVLIDIGGKAEASIPLSEFPVINGQPAVRVGDVIPVVRLGRGEDGSTRYSHKQARIRAAQKNIRDAVDNKVPISGRVSAVVKGGLMVDIGLDAFMPASQVDLFKVADLNVFVGQDIEAHVLEFDQRRNRAVLSRRSLLFERRESTRRTALEKLTPGTHVKGTVKSVLDFGVFVDLGDIDGFIPREELSWDRGKAPGEILKVGEQTEVRILNISADSGKVTLSRKRLTTNPWDNIEARFAPGTIVQGNVVAIQSYGAFVHIEEGITGMIHASDMSWAPGTKKPQDFVRVGDTVTSQVLEIDHEKKRISLGLKQFTRDPWIDVQEKYKPKTKHKGTITSLTNYGAFVKLDDYVEGLVHVSDISWEKRINHPKDHLKVGEEVEVVVLKIDNETRRISLGIKQASESPFDAYLKAHPVGSIVTGKVTRFAPFGAFVELAPSLEGLIHISQIDEKRVELPEKALTAGEEVTVKITGVEKKNNKISLSRREAIRAAEKEHIKAYMSKKSDKSSGGMSFGEALRAAQEKKDN